MNNITLSQLISAEEKCAQRRTDQYKALAHLRWSRETGGLALPDGTRVLTSRESQAQISGVMACLQSGLIDQPMDWKLATGWVRVTPSQIAQIAAAVSDHVRRCFAAERTVTEQMDTQPGDLSDFDINTAFEVAYLSGG